VLFCWGSALDYFSAAVISLTFFDQNADGQGAKMRRKIQSAILELTQGNLVLQEVDAIVNAANSALAGGGGVDGAIHQAGGPEIMAETQTRYPDGCPTGGAVITSAGQLPASHVIHAVGPIWQGGRQQEPDQLQAAYRSSLELAVQHACRSIAFPAISTGVYGYPLDRAATGALEEVIRFLKQHGQPELVRFVLFGPAAYGAFSRVLEELIPG
jgi:O-acetyl-ADP-ribose deacetylase (regulator of RNase III)